MTTTNRAFIKAYRKDAPQPVPLPPASAPARPAAVTQRAAVAAGERSALYRPLAEKQPLSSYIAQAANRPLVERHPNDFLRPGTTVASFHWPATCRALAQKCGPELDRVAERLAAEAASGRSLIGVIGLQPGQGATTTALCLAARLTARERRIILVDANFAKPDLATLLEAVPTAGWQDVLLHGAPLADAVIRANNQQLDLLALSAKQTADALRLVSGLQAVVTAGVLRHAYDLVLVDAGAFSEPAAQPVVSAMLRNMGFDAALAVTTAHGDDKQFLGNLADNLTRSGCELIGVIENRTAKTQAA